ncbi:serine hydrolase domain-containing protein [Flavobacterium sp.]|uniref:serine hydrolase domain-containing protein n=1 Tax=Flavobacterium sp. TaxID=239 RepID=UPI0037535DE6
MIFKRQFSIFSYIFLIFLLVSCKNETQKIKPKTKEESKIDSIYTMQPLSKKFPELKSSEKRKLQRTIEKFYQEKFVPNDFSGSFLVAKNGNIIYEKYRGFSNFEQKKPITSDTPLHIASLSKVITATTIMLLVDSKKISLDQKVNTILADFPYPDITIRTLLNHRSGMRNYSYFTDKKDIWDQKNTLQNSDLISIINKNNIDLEYKTNSHFAYCNTNYAFLALVIEKITHLSYSEALKKLIFKPLKMKNTFVFDLKNKDTVSQSYKGQKIKYSFNYLDNIYGDKNIYSTPRDLLKFDMATYNENFLNKKLLKEVFKGYSYESKGTRNYGLGIRMLEWDNGKKMFYHNGWWHGNTAAYLKLKDEKTTLICISNKYTRCTYKIKLLSGLFGNYPYELKSKNDSIE